MAELGRLPEVGEQVRVGPLTLTVSELDGRRASRITVSRAEPVTASTDDDPSMGGSPA